ncbi:hypothetical protein [Halarcobacter anaerophilus]|uniref:Uncharacterized protein n=1 Tax=Halarcobacter anaerophilus TaxID=877500 RepID=A0A4Q0Y188_9BACT|nr:hypothetical protein [Halarcobacter anaerophilus]QDF29922.1 hypothetical protein AANAER_2466 [Halarcobacter anaerophilus]RXJ62884.1 hypothetical protein CRV06_08600 [Halarcobacter anaerophilus]
MKTKILISLLTAYTFTSTATANGWPRLAKSDFPISCKTKTISLNFEDVENLKKVNSQIVYLSEIYYSKKSNEETKKRVLERLKFFTFLTSDKHGEYFQVCVK